MWQRSRRWFAAFSGRWSAYCKPHFKGCQISYSCAINNSYTQTHTHTYINVNICRLSSVCKIFGLIDRLKAFGLLALSEVTLPPPLCIFLSLHLSLSLSYSFSLCLSVKCTNDFSMATTMPHPDRLRLSATDASLTSLVSYVQCFLCPSAIKHIYFNFYAFSRF